MNIANQHLVEASIPYPELLSYAQSLSAFTSAPPNMPDLSLPGQPPPPLFFPPFPNEEKMRKGHLNAEAPLGLLGETHTVGRRMWKCILLCIFLFLITILQHPLFLQLSRQINSFMEQIPTDKTFGHPTLSLSSSTST